MTILDVFILFSLNNIVCMFTFEVRNNIYRVYIFIYAIPYFNERI